MSNNTQDIKELQECIEISKDAIKLTLAELEHLSSLSKHKEHLEKRLDRIFRRKFILEQLLSAEQGRGNSLDLMQEKTEDKLSKFSINIAKLFKK